jgi:GT2 family glycosyltransferase
MITYLLSSYQKARYLPSVLAALAEDRRGLESEVHIIDDGSRDGSPEILDVFAAAQPGVTFEAQENRGIFKVTNQLLGKGAMPWIRIIDSDDPIIPGSTRRMVAAAERHDLDYLFGSKVEYGPEPLIRAPRPSHDGGAMHVELIDDALHHAVTAYNHVPSCTLIRREATQRCGLLPERFISCQDLALALLIFEAGRVGRTREAVCNQLVGAPARLSSNEALTFQQTVRIIQHFGRAGFDERMRRIAARKLVSRTLRWLRRCPHDGRAAALGKLFALRLTLWLRIDLSWDTYLDAAAEPLERELGTILSTRHLY